jgi:hypothetical protein
MATGMVDRPANTPISTQTFGFIAITSIAIVFAFSTEHHPAIFGIADSIRSNMVF